MLMDHCYWIKPLILDVRVRKSFKAQILSIKRTLRADVGVMSSGDGG